MNEQLSDNEELVAQVACATYEAQGACDWMMLTDAMKLKVMNGTRNALARCHIVKVIPRPNTEGIRIVEEYYDSVQIGDLGDNAKALAKSIDDALAARTEAAKQVMRDALYERTEQCAKIVENTDWRNFNDSHPKLARDIRKLNEAT